MNHHLPAIFIALAFLAIVAVFFYLRWYEMQHTRPCSLCGDTGMSDDGIPCAFCGWRKR